MLWILFKVNWELGSWKKEAGSDCMFVIGILVKVLNLDKDKT